MKQFRITLQKLKSLWILLVFSLESFAQCTNPNAVVNGDFESGTAGFTTGLTFQSPFYAANPYTYGYYDVTSNAANEGNQYNGLPHTGNGMMVIDAAQNVTTIWSQTLTGLTPGCCYTFSFWIRATSATSNPNFINVFYNSNVNFIANVGTTQAWTQWSGTFYATGNSTVIQIIQNAVGTGGFDFSIDDISILACPPPKTVCQDICKTNDKDYVQHIIKMEDGSLALNGTLYETSPSTDRDMYVLKLDPAMDLAGPTTAKRIGDPSGARAEDGHDIIQASDGFLYAVGTITVTATNRDVLVTKLDPVTLAVIWSYRYGTTTFHETGVKIIEADANPTNQTRYFIVAGTHISAAVGGNADIFAFKIDQNGVYNTAVNTHVYRGATASNEAVYNGMKLLNDPNQFVLTGEMNTAGNQDFLALRINVGTLNLMAPNSYFTGQYDINSNEVLTGIAQIGNTLYVTGTTNWLGNGSNDAVMLRLPASFTYTGEFSTVYGKASSNAFEYGADITVTNDGHLAIAGYKDDVVSATRRDGLVFKVNSSNYSVMWNKSMFNLNPALIYADGLNDIVQMNSGQFAVAGYKGITTTDEDIFVSLFDASGASCCLQNYPLNAINKDVHPGNTVVQTTKVFTRTSHMNDVFAFCIKKWCTQAGTRIGIEDESTAVMKGRNFSIVPNPNRGIFTVIPGENSSDIRVFNIYDVSGRILIHQEYENAPARIEVNNQELNSGIYFIELLSKSNRFVEKLIIE